MSDQAPRPPTPDQIRAINATRPITPIQLAKARSKNDAMETQQLNARGVHRSDVADKQVNMLRLDGWANVMTGLGGPMDKRRYSFFADYPIITDPELERMYFGDGLGARIVDVVADDMTREWIKLEAEEDEESADEQAMEVIGDVLQDIDAQTVFNLGLKWKRLYGGAAIVMGVLDGQTLDMPLNPSRITGFDYLRVIDRSDIDLFQSIYQNDPTKPGFGQPELLYMYFQVGVVRYPKLVHISRVCLLKGKAIPNGATPTTTLSQRFWGLSVFNGLYDVLSDYNSSMASAINVLQEFVIGKFKMAGLADMMAEGNEATVQKRMQLIQTMKSVLHAIMMDADNEDYTRDSVTVTGISDVIDRAALRVCAAAGISYKRLWGDAPGGLSTNDESGERTYYDLIRSQQYTDLLPPLKKLLMVIQAWKNTNTDIKIEFNPLYSLSEVEEATVNLQNAQADAAEAQMYSAYVMDGVLQPEQVFALKWADKLDGVVVESFGPTSEEIAQALAVEALAQIQAAAATGQQQAGSEAAPGGPLSSNATGAKTGLATGPSGGLDPIGAGKG